MSTSYKHQISMGFNRPWNLVRDQGVGGSNPLSPTIYFQQQLPNFELRQISAEGKSVTLACFPNICQQ
jgi:hypothetical protein